MARERARRPVAGGNKACGFGGFLRSSVFGAREVWPPSCYMMVRKAAKSKSGELTVAMEKKVLNAGKKTGSVVKGSTKSTVGTVKPAPKVITALRIT
jgi:hypothetical protein